MCGLVAVIDKSGSLSENILTNMRDRLVHRGPDGYGNWIGQTSKGLIGLGHRRLSILDLSEAAAQPMFGKERKTVIVYNGEIYNYMELRSELVKLGHRFVTESDTEVLLAAYTEWNDSCLLRLNGMFAFAIWDLEEQRLFIARDRFGEKPLFYSHLKQGGIVFGSEIKAVAAHPDVRVVVNDEMVDRYVSGFYTEDSESTFFKNIFRVPPAYAMYVNSQGEITRKRRYWIPDYNNIIKSYNEDEIIENFHSLLEKSVKRRLRSDVPVGTSLSGGLDSSSLVCLIANERRIGTVVTQNTFSARFDEDPTVSEGKEIDMVVKHANVNAFSTNPDPYRLIEESRELHWHQEEPIQSASIYLQWCVARLAAENATTVLIDGQGADELLAGYAYYFPTFQLDMVDRRQIIKLWNETHRFSSRLNKISSNYIDGKRRFKPDIAMKWKQLFGAIFKSRPVLSGPYNKGVPEAQTGHRLRRQISEALQYNSLPLLLRYADRNAMAFSRESRYPFLDHELVDWCISLPDQAFICRGWQKYVLRKAMNNILPSAIQWRADKIGYAAPQDNWLRGALKTWAADRLFTGEICSLKGYKEDELQNIWNRHQEAGEDHSWTIWKWITLNEWFSMLKDTRWETIN